MNPRHVIWQVHWQVDRQVDRQVHWQVHWQVLGHALCGISTGMSDKPAILYKQTYKNLSR
jgi:hypothetical protein